MFLAGPVGLKNQFDFLRKKKENARSILENFKMGNDFLYTTGLLSENIDIYCKIQGVEI